MNIQQKLIGTTAALMIAGGTLAFAPAAQASTSGEVAPAGTIQIDQRAASVDAASSSGWTGVKPTFRGVEYWMSDSVAKAVSSALKSGSLSTVLGKIPGGALVGSILQNLGSGKIDAANKGSGVIIKVPWIGFPQVRGQ